MKVELIKPEPKKDDVNIVLTNKEAEELCTFLGNTSVDKINNICVVKFDNEVLVELFRSLDKIVTCR